MNGARFALGSADGVADAASRAAAAAIDESNRNHTTLGASVVTIEECARAATNDGDGARGSEYAAAVTFAQSLPRRGAARNFSRGWLAHRRLGRQAIASVRASRCLVDSSRGMLAAIIVVGPRAAFARADDTVRRRRRRRRSRAGTRTPTGPTASRSATSIATRAKSSLFRLVRTTSSRPGRPNQGQPTYFYPRRHWGVFAVKVPADFRRKSRLDAQDARKDVHDPGQSARRMADRRARGRSRIQQHAAGADASAPADRRRAVPAASPSTARRPSASRIALDVIAKDDGANSERRAGAGDADLVHASGSGGGDVRVRRRRDSRRPVAPSSTTATFSKPGDYILRVRANDSDVTAAGHSQCCWTNAFVKVRVTP